MEDGMLKMLKLLFPDYLVTDNLYLIKGNSKNPEEKIKVIINDHHVEFRIIKGKLLYENIEQLIQRIIPYLETQDVELTLGTKKESKMIIKKFTRRHA